MNAVLHMAAVEEGAPMRSPVLVSSGGVPPIPGEGCSCMSPELTLDATRRPRATGNILR
jgi:hypothetical protein